MASEPPRDAASAWTWRQLNDELDRRAGVSLETLQAKSEKLCEQLRRATVELIDKRSWASQAHRTSSRRPGSRRLARHHPSHRQRSWNSRFSPARRSSQKNERVSRRRSRLVMPLSRVVEKL